MARRGKKYQEAINKIDRARQYKPREALELVKETSYATFDASVDLHMRLGVNPRHAEQQVRGIVRLPHGLGKEVRVAVFTSGEGVRLAEEAGADFVIYDDEGIKKVEEGWTDFDIAIATPEMMGKVGRLGRILGPRGLMPNPKTNTVVQQEDLPEAIEETKAGRVEFRTDKTANIHVPIGRASFPVDKLMDNMTTVVEAIRRARPPAAKGQYIRKIVVTATMSPGIKVDPVEAQMMETEI